MAIDVGPDVEAAVYRLLSTDVDVLTLVASTSIVPELPDPVKDWPAVRYQRIYGQPIDNCPRTVGVERVGIQLDCWGGSRAEAHTLAQTCRAVVTRRLPPDLGDGVNAGVDAGGIRSLFDVDVPTRHGRARPRYVVSFAVTVRPYWNT